MPSDYDWLKLRITRLLDIAKPLKTVHPDVFYDTGSWSIVKLLTVLRFVPIYTKIIKAPKQRGFFDKMFYIDLLAGSGLCRIGGSKGDIVAGSASVACGECYHPFDKYLLVEKDPAKAQALKARIGTMTSNFEVFQCDCNECIGQIMSEIGDKSHYLAFVDCEGLDVSWSTMKALFAKNGDVLFNFQTQEICRLPTIVRNRSKGCEAMAERLNWYFGDDGWRNCTSPDQLLQLYIDKIRRETSREIVLPLPVKGERSYRYDIVLATRKTRGGSPWIQPMKELQEIMGGYRPEIIRETLDILMKRQLSLNDSFS